jgi:transposase
MEEPPIVLNGILWVLRTGAPWADLPETYPSFQTCHRRFQQWVRSGVMKGILEATCFRAEAQTCYRRTGGFHRRDLCAGEKRGLESW